MSAQQPHSATSEPKAGAATKAPASARVRVEPSMRFAVTVPLAIIGAGACGVTAALAARAGGIEPLVLERDPLPRGSTAMSSGFVPAPGSRAQRARGIDDSPARFMADVQAKAAGRADPVLAQAYADAAGPAIDWLSDAHGVPFDLLEGFLYPGHSVARMHAVPERTGEALLGRLWRAAEADGIALMTDAAVVELVTDGYGTILGLVAERPDGSREAIGTQAVLLACNGYGGDPSLVARWIPALAGARYFGHAGNRGDAVRWGESLGAGLADLSACQGHGSLAEPHGILITWALMTEGGVQVDAEGRRFWNEHEGYSEAALAVLARPGNVAWDVYDARLHALGMTFPDYRQAYEAGAVREGRDAAALAAATGLPAAALEATLAEIDALGRQGATDRFGRRFDAPRRLAPPYFAVKVTGALFHTQGGLTVDARMRVLRRNGRPLPNLWAAGGAARGVSGDALSGYLSGNGLLSAIAGGWLAGNAAAAASSASGI